MKKNPHDRILQEENLQNLNKKKKSLVHKKKNLKFIRLSLSSIILHFLFLHTSLSLFFFGQTTCTLLPSLIIIIFFFWVMKTEFLIRKLVKPKTLSVVG